MAAVTKNLLAMPYAAVGKWDTRRAKMAEGPFDVRWIGGGSDGKYIWDRCHGNSGFQGTIKDIRIWDTAVDWNEAVAGSAQSSTPSPPSSGDGSSDLPASCISSKINSWDFVCGEEVPPEVAEEVGLKLGVPVDKQAKDAFREREGRGVVTGCGPSSSVRGAIFHGKFGDGLTGEYFRVCQNCHAPSFLGRVPYTVRVDQR